MYTLVGIDSETKLYHIADWSDYSVDAITESELKSCLEQGFKVSGCRLSQGRVIARMVPIRHCQFQALPLALNGKRYGAVQGYYLPTGKKVSALWFAIFDLEYGDIVAVLLNEPCSDGSTKLITKNWVLDKTQTGIKRVRGLAPVLKVEGGCLHSLMVSSDKDNWACENIYFVQETPNGLKFKHLGCTGWYEYNTTNSAGTSLYFLWQVEVVDGKEQLRYMDKNGKVVVKTW